MKKGFTLIELMIVVVIIGILAAIAIPKFSEMQEQEEQTETFIRGIVTSYTYETVSISPHPGAIAEVYRTGRTRDMVIYAEIQAVAVGDSIISYEILKEE